MKRKWYQFETVIKVESDSAIKFRDEFNQLCLKSYKEKGSVFVGIMNLPDGTSAEVNVSVSSAGVC